MCLDALETPVINNINLMVNRINIERDISERRKLGSEVGSIYSS